MESGSFLGPYGTGPVAVSVVGVGVGDIDSVAVVICVEGSIAVGSTAGAVVLSVGQDVPGTDAAGVGDEGASVVGVVPVGTGVGDVPVGAEVDVPVGVGVGVGDVLPVPEGDDDVGGIGADGEGVAVVVGLAVAVPVDPCVGVGDAVAVPAVPGVDTAAGSGSGALASSSSPLRTVWELSAATGMAQRCPSEALEALPS